MLHVIHVKELHLRDKNLNLSLITDFKYHQKKRRKNKFAICTHHTPDLASMSDRHFSVWSMSDILLFS